MYSEMKKNIENSAIATSSADDVGAGERPLAEDRERDERRLRAQLDRDERGEQRERDGAEAERLAREPARVVGVDERVDEQRQAGGHRDGAGDVEVARAVVAALGQQARREDAAAARPIGTLTNSTHSQPAYSVSMPPSSTPAAPPEPATAPQTPSALLRSAPSANITVTSDSAAGESSAAPRPWTARAAISRPGEWRGRRPARRARRG